MTLQKTANEIRNYVKTSQRWNSYPEMRDEVVNKIAPFVGLKDKVEVPTAGVGSWLSSLYTGDNAYAAPNWLGHTDVSVTPVPKNGILPILTHSFANLFGGGSNVPVENLFRPNQTTGTLGTIMHELSHASRMQAPDMSRMSSFFDTLKNSWSTTPARLLEETRANLQSIPWTASYSPMELLKRDFWGGLKNSQGYYMSDFMRNYGPGGKGNSVANAIDYVKGLVTPHVPENLR